MRIVDAHGEHDAQNPTIAERLMRERNISGMNEFILHSGLGVRVGRPTLVISVNMDLAYVHYFPDSDDHPGYQSIGAVPGLDAEGVTLFICGGYPPTEVSNSSVVSFDDALLAVHEFFDSPLSLPGCLQWYEL